MVPNRFGTRDLFHGREFFHGQWSGGGMVQAVMRLMGSDGERQMKLSSLVCCSPPAVQPGLGLMGECWGPLSKRTSGQILKLCFWGLSFTDHNAGASSLSMTNARSHCSRLDFTTDSVQIQFFHCTVNRIQIVFI